jgi:predicted GTPase
MGTMADLAPHRRVLIMSAAGRDFHNFLRCDRDDPQTEVAAFTAAHIPSIAGRRYPASLAGPSYPDGIPIYPESDLEGLIATLHVDEVVFAYSGDLAAQRVQRFATLDDLDRHQCTIEESEEYAPHVEQGTVVYAGVDYQAILRAAETEADVLVWDGGNNDLPFLRPDVHICLVDPHRPGHETLYYPGTANLRLANFVVIAKEETADPEHVRQVKAAVHLANPHAIVIDAAAPLHVSDPALIAGKRVWVIEDGPTLTHGGMTYGAGTIAAMRWGAVELVDPRSLPLRGQRTPSLTGALPYARGSIAVALETYPAMQRLLPAMGYSAHQMAELEATVNATPCDAVVFGTPVELRCLLTLHVPAVRVSYDIEEIGEPTLETLVPFCAQKTRAQHCAPLHIRQAI